MGVRCLMVVVVVVFVMVKNINGEDPYRFFTWNVTYGDIYPLGVKQQVLLFIYFSSMYLLSGLFLFSRLDFICLCCLYFQAC